VKVAEVASLLNGEILGDKDVTISGVSGIRDAGEGDITFLSSQRFARYLRECKASCLLVKEYLPDVSIVQIKVQDPHRAFVTLLEFFHRKSSSPPGISSLASVSSGAKIADDASVLPFAYIGENVAIGKGTVIHPFAFIGDNTHIGQECLIYPHVVLIGRVHIGDRVTIHAGTIIGADGFGYLFHEGMHLKVPQIGGVKIGDDVEIGANVTIDRATTGSTTIGSGTKIDNLVQIGHNVNVGRNALLCGQVGVSGSTDIGDYAVIGGQAGVADHTQIDAGTMIGAQAGVMGTVRKGVYSGSPAIGHRDWLKSQALFARLPEMQKRIRELEEVVERLKGGDDD
jgi:UDP-3-O-[3-hydroxymyristoyl] glucosamine N-acyltransferase